MHWTLWAVLLVAQNATFTLVSRARNSGSLGYHAIAAVLSSAVWFSAQLILVDNSVRILHSGNLRLGIFAAVFYTTFTLIGSLGIHWLALRKLEKGSRRVGGS